MPFAVIGRSGDGLHAVDGNRYFLSCIGSNALDKQRLITLQHHIIGINGRHGRAAVIACNGGVNSFCKDGSTFCIGMHSIRKELRIGIQRRMEID